MWVNPNVGAILPLDNGTLSTSMRFNPRQKNVVAVELSDVTNPIL